MFIAYELGFPTCAARESHRIRLRQRWINQFTEKMIRTSQKQQGLPAERPEALVNQSNWLLGPDTYRILDTLFIPFRSELIHGGA